VLVKHADCSEAIQKHRQVHYIHGNTSRFRCIKDKGYVFEERGEIEIKGKGNMTTYFLHGMGDMCVPLPPIGTPGVKKDSVVFTEFKQHQSPNEEEECKRAEESGTKDNLRDQTKASTTDDKRNDIINEGQNNPVPTNNSIAESNDENMNFYNQRLRKKENFQRSGTCILL
jgi:hypothetical protein